MSAVDRNQFFVKSGNESFKNKQKSIFDLIATEEKNVNLSINEPEEMEVDVSDRRCAKRNRRETRALRGQESLFKCPGSPPPRKRFIPDFQRNPHRWTKYTLADVPSSDMSEATNTAAALSFLRNRRRPAVKETLRFTSKRIRPRTFDPEGNLTPESERVGFGDPCEPVEEARPPEKPTTYVNGRLTMPEYFVGQRSASVKKVEVTKRNPVGKELMLSHLHENDDE